MEQKPQSTAMFLWVVPCRGWDTKHDENVHVDSVKGGREAGRKAARKVTEGGREEGLPSVFDLGAQLL